MPKKPGTIEDPVQDEAVAVATADDVAAEEAVADETVDTSVASTGTIELESSEEIADAKPVKKSSAKKVVKKPAAKKTVAKPAATKKPVKTVAAKPAKVAGKRGRKAAEPLPKGVVNAAAAAVRALRKVRGETVEAFAVATGFNHGPAIARTESADYWGTTIATLARIAVKTKTTLVIKFVAGK